MVINLPDTWGVKKSWKQDITELKEGDTVKVMKITKGNPIYDRYVVNASTVESTVGLTGVIRRIFDKQESLMSKRVYYNVASVYIINEIHWYSLQDLKKVV